LLGPQADGSGRRSGVAARRRPQLPSPNIPWIFRMPPDASIEQAVRTLADATEKTGANRGRVRQALASGATVNARGEMR